MSYLLKILQKIVLGSSWRTSLLGWAGMIGSLGVLLTSVGDAAKYFLDGDAATNPDWVLIGVAWAALAGNVAALFSRDNKVTSEQAEAGKKNPTKPTSGK